VNENKKDRRGVQIIEGEGGSFEVVKENIKQG